MFIDEQSAYYLVDDLRRDSSKRRSSRRVKALQRYRRRARIAAQRAIRAEQTMC